MTAEDRIAHVNLPVEDLRTVINSLTRHDMYDLKVVLWDGLREAEGKLTPEEDCTAAEEILAQFREGVSQVKGYKEAVAQAYLTEHPRRIRLTDVDGQEWNVSYHRRTGIYNDTNAKIHEEGLAMFTDEGIGFSVHRNWWTDYASSLSPQHGRVSFTSDATRLQDGTKAGYHPSTQVGINLAKSALDKLLANK